eukprot:6817591-Prymnesium_polylepis.1
MEGSLSPNEDARSLGWQGATPLAGVPLPGTRSDRAVRLLTHRLDPIEPRAAGGALGALVPT